MKNKITALLITLALSLILAINVFAVDTLTLQALYYSIPDKASWNEIYIDTSTMSYWYDQASNILSNPSKYDQSYVDGVQIGLSNAYAQVELHLTKIDLADSSVNLNVGASKTLKLNKYPSAGADKITWKSSDSKSVSVDSDGKITALKHSSGAVTITATSANGLKDTCKVTTVNQLDSLKLSVYEKSIYETQSFSITATAVAKDSSAALSSPAVFTWDSSNPSVCIVDDYGKVSALKPGSANIICTVKSGNTTKSLKCNVEVKEIISINGFTPQFTTVGGAITLIEGESTSLAVRITPETATIKTLTWKSKDTSVAKINSAALTDSVSTASVTALKKGSTTITYAATDNSGKSGKITVNVLPKVSSLTISKKTTVIEPGKTLKLTATIAPKDAGNQVLSWSTTDSNVCTVDKNGNVRSVARGTCNITAKTTDGSNLSVVCKIRVANKATSLALNKTEVLIEAGKKTTITPTVTTSIGTTYSDFVKYVSSDKNVATVDENGVVTAKNTGLVAITVSTLDGTNLSKVCTLQVIRHVTGITCTASKMIGYKETYKLKPTVSPSDASNKKVKYSSSDTTIATVDSTGLVTAKSKYGTTTITCITEDGSYKAKCKITVCIPTTSIKLSKSNAALWVGEKLTLKSTISPSNASDKKVTYTSSNAKIAKVDSTGKVTAVASGVCTITATASGGQKAKCTVSVSQKVKSIAFSKTSYSIYKGQSYTPKLNLNPSGATPVSESYKSSNTSIATVSSTGVVKGKEIGSCTITATIDGKKASTTIKVTKKINAQSIDLSKSELSLAPGKTGQLSPVFTPSNTSNKSVTWKSSNTSIATVDSSGKVTAKKAGTCNITCTSADGGKKAVCVVYVDVKLRALRFVNEKENCSVGETKQIKISYYPSNTSDKSLTWTSSKPSVATVNSKGYVEGISSGTTTITASSKSGITVSIQLKVSVEVTSIKMAKTSMKLEKGDSAALLVTIKPKNATNQKVSWKSNNTNVVFVKDGVVTALRNGSAVVTATSKDGGYTAKCYIEVVSYVQTIKIEYNALNINAGTVTTVTAYASPNTATNTNLIWESSNKKIATVSTVGKIKAISAGKCDIICKSEDGHCKAVLKLTVIQPCKSIKFAKETYYCPYGATTKISPTISPKNASNKTVRWSSNNTAVAVVSSDGTVTGLKKGNCTLTATTVQGGLVARCVLEVYQPVTGISLNKTMVTIFAGKKTTITPIISPSSAPFKDVKWKSNNLDVATVDKNGVVTTKAPGYVEITATTKEGGFKATCKINVLRAVTGVKITTSGVSLDVNEVKTLKAKISPSDATNTALKWSSSNKEVVKVDSSGKITALKKGNATITVKTVDGGYMATCNVAVYNKVHDIDLSDTKLTLYLGSTKTIIATVVPSNAKYKTLTFESSNQDIILVSSSGKITPVKTGTAYVNVKSVQDGVTVKCKVTVEVPAKSLTLSKTSATLKVGDKLTVTGTVAPTNTTNKALTYSTSDKSVATVSKTGEIKAIAEGNAVITVTTSNGLTKTVNIVVKPK